MDNELINAEPENIKTLIYTIRGKQVMLDSDVAMLYNYETKRINETMKRNIERFPKDFCFQLNEKELRNLRSQIATSNKDNTTYISNSRRFLPYVYTEQRNFDVSSIIRK